MTIDARGWVSVVELIVFIPSGIASFILCRRHGFTKSSGWIYTLILCIIRIASSICQLISESDESVGLLTAVVILDSIGLSPLLFATLGMLSRLTDEIALFSESGSALKVSHFRVVQLVITLGLILAIVGGATSTSSTATGAPPATSKAGVILYIFAFLALMFILFVSLGKLRVVPTMERRVAIAVLCAAPFILVRLAYSVLAVFLHNSDFNVVDGKIVYFVVMRVLEEFIVVLIYILVGFSIQTLAPDQQGPIATRAWKDRNKGGRRGNRGTDYAMATQGNERDSQGYPPQTHHHHHRREEQA